MKIAIFDYDDTLSSGVMRYQLGIEMEKAGLIRSGFTLEINELQDDYDNEKISYNEKFAQDKKIFSRYYKDVKRVDIVRFLEEEYDLKQYIKPWAVQLVRSLKEKGFITVVISGSWDFIIEEAQGAIAFDSFFASEMEFVDGGFTGTYSRVIDYRAKETITKQLLKDADHSVGLGDSQADLSFLQHVDKGFLYLPDRRVTETNIGSRLTVVNDNNVISMVTSTLN